MKKIVRIAALVLITLLALIIIIPFAFKGKLLRIAEEQMNNNLNAKVEIGNLRLSLIRGFPDLFVALDNLTITGINEFSGDTLVSFKSFSAKVDLMSAIKMTDINVKSILMISPVINGIITKEGKANWDIMKPSADTSAVAETDTAAGPMKFSVKLKKFEIQHADITYDDRQGAMFSSIKNLNFKLKGNLTQDVTELDINSTIDKVSFSMGGIRYLNNARFTFVASVAADMAKAIYAMKENEMSLNDLTVSLNGNVQMPADGRIITDLTYKTKKTDFKTILSMVPAVYMNDFKEVQTAGTFSLDGIVKGTYKDSIMPSVDLNLIVNNAMFSYPGMPRKAENIAVILKIHYDGLIPDSTTVNLEKFHVEMANNPFDAMLMVKTPMSDMQISSEIKGTLDLASITQIIPLDSTELSGILTADISMMGRMSSIEKQQYEDFNAQGTMNLKGFRYSSPDLPQQMIINEAALSFTPRFVELLNFDAVIGKSDIRLKGKLENFIPYAFSNDTIAGTLVFTSSVLDINELMGTGETTEQPAQTAQPSADTASLTTIEVPGNIDFTLTSTIGKIVYDKLDITNVSGMLIVRDSKVEMKNVNMNMLQGSLVMNGEYNTQDMKKPSTGMNLQISNFDIPSSFTAFNTVKQMAPIAEKCTGKYSMNFDFTTQLDGHLQPVMNSFMGQGQMMSKSVQVNNATMFTKLGELLKDDKYKTITLSDLNIKFKIENGRIYLDPFDTRIGSSKATISGDQGLDQTMNFIVNTSVPHSALGSQANAALKNLLSGAAAKGINVDAGSELNVDALVGGTTADPKITLQLRNASAVTQSVKQQVQQKVQQQVTKVVDDSKAKARAEADRILREAEAQAAQIRSSAKTASDAVRSEGYANADKLVREAKNPVAKKAAEVAAKKMKDEADKKANAIVSEGDQKSNALLQQARDQANKLTQ